MKSFAHIFRREGIKAQVIEGDSFHRYNRVADARARAPPPTAAAARRSATSGPRPTCSPSSTGTFAEYGDSGRGRVRRYVHDAAESKELNARGRHVHRLGSR